MLDILRPYCTILNILQSDKARLHQIIISLGYLVQFWKGHNNVQLSEQLISRLERRWRDWEQPLLILACLLHPNYRMEHFNRNINYTNFGPWLAYYYKAWFGKEASHILKEFDDFRRKQYPFDETTWNQFSGDIYRYWCFAGASTEELGLVANRIFGICTNAAAVERLWSCMGFLHTNRRNRLMVGSITYITFANDAILNSYLHKLMLEYQGFANEPIACRYHI